MSQNFKCFINEDRMCTSTCMAYCGKPDDKGVEKPACTFIHSLSVMGAVSAYALADVMKSKVVHPKSAPPPQVIP
jgi:hypothetical protein